MHLNLNCPTCGNVMTMILPKKNIHVLPEGKIVGMTIAYTDCSVCESQEKPHRYEAIITIAMTQLEVK